MDTAIVSPRVRRFGPFELSIDAGELRKSGLRLKLQEQPFHVLCALIEHPGEIVTREQLRQQLWPEGTFVDFEHGLNTAIKKIRDVLDDDPEAPRYIETIPRKGYRFIGKIENPRLESCLPPPAPTARKFSPFLMATFSVICVVTLGAVAIRQLNGPPRIRITNTKQLTFDGGVSNSSTIETDGRRVFFFRYADTHIYSLPVHGGNESSTPTHFLEPVILCLSPDGSTLLVKEVVGPEGGTADRIWLLPTNGGQERPLADVVGDAAAFSPDGATIAVARGRRVFFTDIHGTVKGKTFEIQDQISWIRYSPDGHRLRFTAGDSVTHAPRIWEAASDGSGIPSPLSLDAGEIAAQGIWIQGGHFVFMALRDMRWDCWITRDNRLALGGHKSAMFVGGGLETLFAAASPLEKIMILTESQSSSRTFTLSPPRQELAPLMSDVSLQNPVVARDGTWMAVIQVQNLQRTLWRVRRDGTEWTQLTDANLYAHHARISPDGKRIALMAVEPKGAWKVFWMPAEGGAIHALDVPLSSQTDPNWMPDNDSVVFGQPPRYFAEPESSRALYIASISHGTFEQIPGSENWFSPRISSDGKKLLALSINEHRLGLFDFSTRSWRVLLEKPTDRIGVPFWSPDDQWAYVNWLHDRRWDVVRVNLRNSSVHWVTTLTGRMPYPECWAWSAAPNGSIFVSCIHPVANVYAVSYE